MTLDYTFERRLQLAREENREFIEALTEKNQISEENERLAAELARLKEAMNSASML